MKTNKATNYAVQFLITLAGGYGIMNVLMDGIEYEMHNAVSFVILLFSAAWVAGLVWIKRRKLFVGIVTAILVVLGLIMSSDIYMGICEIINNVIYYGNLSKGYSIPYVTYNGYSLNAESVAMIVIAVFTVYIVGLNVSRIRSMALAVLNILPFIAVFVTFSIIPSMINFIMCILYVLGTSALRPKEENVRSSLSMIAITLVISMLTCLFVNENTYEQPEVFANLYEIIDGVVSNSQLALNGEGNGEGSVVGGVGMSAKSLFSDGKMGSIDELKYEESDILTVTTINTGRRQYIPIYYGKAYKSGSNTWDIEKDSIGQDYSLTYNLMLMIANSEGMQNYIDSGSGKYDDYTSIYEYSYVNISNSNKEFSKIMFEVSDSYYQRIYSIVKKNLTFEVKNVGRVLSQDEFSTLYDDVYGDIKNKYLGVDGRISSCLFELLGGNQGGATFNDKLAYIKTVKDFLAANYKYTTAPGKVPEGKDFVEYFLEESKQGYCTYFASSATMMFRNAGIPARYVEGFVIEPDEILSGEKVTRNDEWYSIVNGNTSTIGQQAYKVNVKDSSAHAWVEVFIEGFGWVTVEVTPPNMAGGLTGTEIEDPSEPEDATEAESESDDDASQDESDVEDKTEDESGNEQASDDGQAGTLLTFIKDMWWKLLVGLIVVILILAVINRHATKHRALNKIFRSNDIVAMYQKLERLLDELGYGKIDTMSYEDFARYLESRDEIFALHKFSEVTEVALKVRFGGDDVDVESDEVKMACRRIRNIREDLLQGLPKNKRLWYTHFKTM